MRTIILLLYLLFGLMLHQLNGQNAPITTVGSVATYGTTAVVPLTVTDFTSTNVCDLKLTYDPAIATVTAVTKDPAVGAWQFIPEFSIPGEITIAWLSFSPITLQPNSVFATITFDKVTNGYSAIEFDNSVPANCQWGTYPPSVDLNDTPESDYYFDGSVTFASEEIVIRLSAFLEGPFGVSDMTTDLNPLFIQYNQPYNTAPWSYSGDEGFIAVPNANVVDWILVELRQTAGSAATAISSTMVARQAALLLKNGSIVGTDGISNLLFDINVTSNLYVVIWHRNHLGMMSSVPLTLDGDIYNYDFTTAQSKAYANGQVSLGGGKYGMYAGNADGSETISVSDLSFKWDLQVGKSGYQSADMNMNSQVNNQDKNEIWNLNFGITSQVP